MANRAPNCCRYQGIYARVKIGGKWVHLGRYGSPQAESKYRQLVARWAAETAPQPNDAAHDLTVAELLVGYLEHAESYYRLAPRRVAYMKRLVRIVRELYADIPVVEFGPRKLKTVREVIVRRGWVRSKVNEATRDVIAMFSWGVEQEMVPGNLVHALREIRSLRKGHCDAREGRIISSVSLVTVDATLPQLVPVLADMVRLQLLCGCRPGELCNLTPGQIDRQGDVWLYQPVSHKTAHFGHERVIPFGPQAQAVLRKYLLRPADVPCFSPKEAMAQHLDSRREQRRTPMSCGNKPVLARRRRALERVGDRYDVIEYRRAIVRACDRAFPAPEGLTPSEKLAWQKRHRWTPHQLRHTAATRVREQFGLDGSQAILGHRHARVTEVYAELNVAKAVEISRRIG